MVEISFDDALLFAQVPHQFIHTVLWNLEPPTDVQLNKTQIRTLMMLRDRGPASMHSLGNRVGMGKGSFTQVIDGLVAGGLVERYRDQHDRRVVKVAVTPAGRSVAEKLDKNFTDHLIRLLGLLDEDEQQDAVDALKTLRRVTNTLEEKTHAAK